MSLLEQLSEDLKESLKKKETLRLLVIRGLISEIKNRQIEKRSLLTDEEITQLMASAIKKRSESVEAFSNGGRQDLVEKEKNEIEIIRVYMPEVLDYEEIKKIVFDAVKESSASGKKDMGKVMKIVMPKVTGRADGKEVNRIVVECLENQ